MTRRFLDDLLTTSFKYFFDADFHTILHSFTLILVLLATIKLIGEWIKKEWLEGVRTIKENMISIKLDLAKVTAGSASHDHLFSDYTRGVKINQQEHERIAS